MEVDLCYNPAQKMYHVYRGITLVLSTKSYHKALERFNEICDQLKGV